MDLGWRFSLQSFSNIFSAWLPLHHSRYNSHSPLERVVPGSGCCTQPGSMQASPISLLFSQSSLCTCCPQLEKLIYLQTLGLLLQLKPGRSNPLKMHLVEPAPREVPIGVSSIAYRSWTSSARQRNQQRKDPLIWLSLHELLYKLQTRKPCSCNPSKKKVNKQQSVQLHSRTHFCILGSFVITQIHIFILSQM